MKVTFEFDPYEDKEDLALFQHAKKYYCALHYIEEYIRQLRKYDEREAIPAEEISAKFYSILDDNEVSL